MSLTTEVAAGATSTTVRMSGRIDREAASDLDTGYRTASASGARRIVLDFTDVSYINSTGIALIVGVLAAARADQREVVATGLTPHYRHIFEITRLSDFITMSDPEEETT